MAGQQNTLIVVTGPTGSGKTALAIALAQRLNCDIISADSRQIFAGIPITTAAPTAAELATARHHNIGILPLEAYYSAAQFETDTLQLLDKLFITSPYVVMCGGSMMYVDAVTRGIDDIPTISEAVRSQVDDMWHSQGIETVKAKLAHLDPEYYAVVDHNNHKRVVHALEVCIESGVTYTSLRTGRSKPRPFSVLKVAIDLPREVLFARINARVDRMVADGLVDEVRSVYHLRHLNSLNTVGFKEMFAWLDGTWDFPTACARMAKNTRVYAKKQLTWLKRDPEVHWLSPDAGALDAQVLSLLHK